MSNDKNTVPPTLQDVAEALGMHKSTVSYALSGKGTLSAGTRDRILSAAREMGYVPNPIAQRLASGDRNPAVFIFSGVLDVGLATEKILLIQRELTREGFEVPIYTCYESADTESRTQAAQIRQICRQGPRAIICAGQMLDHSVFEELREYQSTGGHVVSYDSAVPLACDQVIFDREHNAYIAAKYLLERGHRSIGLGLPSNIGWISKNYMQPERPKGFLKAIIEYGATVNNEWVFHHSTYERGGEELAKRFMEMKTRPTGLCIINDYVALAFMVTVIRHGIRIPEELSVIGHDNQTIADYCPVPLTSATQPAEEIAHTVVRMLLDRLNGNDEPPRSVIIAGRVIERQSVSLLERR